MNETRNEMKGGESMNGKIVAGVLVAALLIVGIYLFSMSGPVVSAQGFSTLTVQPDKASVYLSVESRSESAQSAKEAHDTIMDDVITALIKLGIERKDIQTVNYNIYPEYEYTNGKQRQIGYIATQQLIIKTNDFDDVARIVDAGVSAGALVSTINFELSQDKQNEYKKQALESAGKDAEAKASATAAGLDKKLGRLVSVGSQDFNYPGPIVYYDRAIAAESSISAQRAAADIAPRDLEVSASVNVQYKLRRW